MAVRPGDPAALADAVRRLKDDPQTRRALAARGLAAAPGFSRERQARQMLAVLELAAAGRGAAAAAEGQAS
jgi:glycosyltransferase involved in cell wall biosynthesis